MKKQVLAGAVCVGLGVLAGMVLRPGPSQAQGSGNYTVSIGGTNGYAIPIKIEGMSTGGNVTRISDNTFVITGKSSFRVYRIDAGGSANMTGNGGMPD